MEMSVDLESPIRGIMECFGVRLPGGGTVWYEDLPEETPPTAADNQGEEEELRAIESLLTPQERRARNRRFARYAKLGKPVGRNFEPREYSNH